MIEVRFGIRFLRSAKQLPTPFQKKLAQCLLLLQKQPFDVRLHTKRLSGEFTGFLSFRINRDWRVIFLFENPQTIILQEVGHRKDIYR